VLKKLTSSEYITTIIPGRLYRTSSNVKSQMQLRFTTSVENTSTSKFKPKDHSTISTKDATLSSKYISEDSSMGGKDHPRLNECNSYSVTQKVIARKSSMMQEVMTTLHSSLASCPRDPNHYFIFDLQVFLVYPIQIASDFDLAHHVKMLLWKEACIVGEFYCNATSGVSLISCNAHTYNVLAGVAAVSSGFKDRQTDR
jgi:hypothetical protein